MQAVATVAIFAISGLLLQRGEALAALRSMPALAYGVAAILFVTPLTALGVLRLPLNPPEMGVGLAVFACMPTSLSTCITLTTAANGNGAVALLLVVVTNLLSVFTVPLMLSAVLGGAAGGAAQFQPAQLFRSLVLTVLIPLAAGLAAQGLIPGFAAWRQRRRTLLSYASTACLCTVPWMQVSKAAAASLPIGPATVAAAAAAGLGLHLLLLAVNAVATPLVQFDPDPAQDVAIRKAVFLCSSQKTLPVAVAVLSQLGMLGAGVGLAVLPCVMAQLLQTVLDSLLVSQWTLWEERRAAAAAPA
eukprot:scaffold16.g96.t1